MEPSPIFNLTYHLVAFSGVDSFLLIVVLFCGYGTTSSSLTASVVSSVDFSSAVLCPLGSVSSVTQLCLTLCDLIDRSTSGFPVRHHSWSLFTLLSIKSLMPSNYLLSSPSPPDFNPSQNQGLFQWVISLHQVAKVLGVSALTSVLPLNIQDWFCLVLTGLISLQSKGLSRVFSTPQFSTFRFISSSSVASVVHWQLSELCRLLDCQIPIFLPDNGH